MSHSDGGDLNIGAHDDGTGSLIHDHTCGRIDLQFDQLNLREDGDGGCFSASGMAIRTIPSSNAVATLSPIDSLMASAIRFAVVNRGSANQCCLHSRGPFGEDCRADGGTPWDATGCRVILPSRLPARLG